MPQKYQKSWENHEISNHVAWPWHVFIQTCNSQSLPAGILHLHDKQNEEIWRTCPFCPFLQGMSQYAPVRSCSFSSVQPALGMSSRSFQTAGLWPSNRPGLKIGNTLGATPAMTIMLWGKSSGKYGKVMRSTGFGAIHGYPVDKTRSWDFLWLWRPPHICPCTQEASKTRQKPRGKSLSCQLGEPCYSCTSPKHSKNLGSKCSAHAVSEVTIFGEGLSSKASPTRKQWSMQTCQINPNHASRPQKDCSRAKRTPLINPFSGPIHPVQTKAARLSQISCRNRNA